MAVTRYQSYNIFSLDRKLLNVLLSFCIKKPANPAMLSPTPEANIATAVHARMFVFIPQFF